MTMKPSKLEDHLRRCHPDKILKIFSKIEEKRPTMHSMFASTSESNDDGYYNISFLIAKSGKLHTIGKQLMLPAVEEVLKTVLHKSPLYAVQRRIDEMSLDIKSLLCNYLQTTHFSIQLDESTLPGNEALLLVYVRFVMGEEATIRENFRGFISHLKRILPEVSSIHCFIHRQHLVAKNLSDRLHQSLQFVINAVDKIRSNALNTRLFAQLCNEYDGDFQRLLLHTEVRWLSKGPCLTRFYSLFESVLEFLENKDPDLKENLINLKAD